MARQGRSLPARKQRDDESLLLRSAESLGRMIGSLQRQLDDATKKLSPRPFVPGVKTTADGDGDGHAKRRAAPRSKGAGKSGVTKVRSTVDRKSKRASKTAAAKKSAGRSRSGAGRRSRKSTRHA